MYDGANIGPLPVAGTYNVLIQQTGAGTGTLTMRDQLCPCHPSAPRVAAMNCADSVLTVGFVSLRCMSHAPQRAPTAQGSSVT